MIALLVGRLNQIERKRDMAAYIDRVFRGYGEEFFGKEAMDKITDEQVEVARCEAYKMLCELTQKYGKQEKGTLEELFNNYIFAYYM